MKTNLKVNGNAMSDTQQATTFSGLEKFQLLHSELVTGGNGTYYYDQYGNYVISSPTGGGADIVDVWD